MLSFDSHPRARIREVFRSLRGIVALVDDSDAFKSSRHASRWLEHASTYLEDAFALRRHMTSEQQAVLAWLEHAVTRQLAAEQKRVSARPALVVDLRTRQPLL